MKVLIGLRKRASSSWPSLHALVILGFITTRQPLWVILCHVPEKGRRERGDERKGQGGGGGGARA